MRSLSLPEPDYGRALRAGLLVAVGEVVVNFDVDFCDLGFLDRAFPMVEATGGPAVVVGSKRTAGSDDTRTWQRRMVTGVFSSLLRYGFGLSVSDTHGVKALRREALAPLARHCRFGQDLFDTELILRAERSGLRSAEIPVEVVEKRPARSSIRARIPRTGQGPRRPPAHPLAGAPTRRPAAGDVRGEELRLHKTWPNWAWSKWAGPPSATVSMQSCGRNGDWPFDELPPLSATYCRARPGRVVRREAMTCPRRAPHRRSSPTRRRQDAGVPTKKADGASGARS